MVWPQCHPALLWDVGNICSLIDIATAASDPKTITDLLESKYQFKLKATGPVGFHLGCDFTQDDDGTMCMIPKQYIKKL